MSIHTFEEMTGIGRDILASIEAGRRAAELSTIDSIAGALRTNRSNLVCPPLRPRALDKLVESLKNASRHTDKGERGAHSLDAAS